MAQTKLYPPKDHHFMINKKGGFYVMKNPSTGYKFHKTANGERSALYILVEVRSYHKTGSAKRSTGAIYTQLKDQVEVRPINTKNKSTKTTIKSSGSRNRSNTSRSTY